MTDKLFQIAASDGVVLTVNKRLARELSLRYDQAQSAAGHAAWATPAIISLEAWTLRLRLGLTCPEAHLTDAQEQYLWEEIIGSDGGGSTRDLLQIPQTARRAREAQHLLDNYHVDDFGSFVEEEHRVFLRWRARWQAGLAENRWLGRSDVMRHVSAAIAAGDIKVPKRIMLAGFDDLKPVEQRLCRVLEERGCQVLFWEVPSLAGGCAQVHAAVDRVDEVQSCARWIRHQLESRPQARIGIVAPNLADYQGLIERLFRAELDPAGCFAESDGPENFSLSLGTPLGREGVVRAALRLLAAEDPLRLEDAGWLLRSPYLGGARKEWLDRATADRMLRSRGLVSWPLGALSRTLGVVPQMAAIVGKLRDARRDNRRRLPGDWAELFLRELDGCGWPGDRGLSSREYQAFDHFRKTLGQLASLDRVARPLRRGAALTILARLCSETVFQPEGREGQVKVLGMLEAAGFEFDALWVLGLHEAAFPAAPRPNPFLPMALQSRLHMPHADADREQLFASRIAQRLFSSAAEIMVSWPCQLDGAAQRPSPFLKGIPVVVPKMSPVSNPFRVLQAAPCVAEIIADDRAMAMPADRPFSGGTNILKDQALCPFRSFAHHRLHAERLETPEAGIDNLARGSLIHGVIERFWRRVGSHEALLAMAEEDRLTILATAAAETLQQHERRVRCDFPPRLRAIESRRLVAVASGWLELEALRSPFRVAEIEQRHTAQVGRLSLRTRIDRIDQLVNGQLAVIDYKTGHPSPRHWLDARVTEPQLPLYCLALDPGSIGAVLFARIRSRSQECTFRGLVRDPSAWPKMSIKSQEKLLREQGLESFDGAIDHWRTALPGLGDDFVDGNAVVDPVDPQRACKYCDLQTLCRIGPQPESAEVTGEGDSDD